MANLDEAGHWLSENLSGAFWVDARVRDSEEQARAGTPTLDGLGAIGGGGHAEHEHVLVDSLAGRGALLAALTETLLTETLLTETLLTGTLLTETLLTETLLTGTLLTETLLTEVTHDA